MDPVLDPLVLTTLQNAFLEKISLAFSVVGAYALNIFYYMAIIELVLFGIIWAIRQEPLIGHMLIKLLKLSVIIFVITEYPYIVQTILDSFTLIAFQSTQPETLEYLNNPGKIWEFGFDAALSLLRISAHYGSLNVSLGNLYLFLGLGILILFTLIGTQILLVMIGFYWVALMGLFLVPFGAFTPLKNMFENSLRQLLVQASRVATLIFIIGIAVSLWQKLHFSAFTQEDTLDKPLGLLISALSIWILSLKLPALVSEAVGRVSSDLLPHSPLASSGETSFSPVISNTNATLAAVSSASQIDPNIYSPSSNASPSVNAGNTASQPMVIATSLSSNSPFGGKLNALSNEEATAIARSISKETVSKLQQSMRPKP